MKNLTRSIALISTICVFLPSAFADDLEIAPRAEEPVSTDAALTSAPATSEDLTADLPVPPGEADPVGALTKLVQAIRNGQWRMAAAAFLSLLMFGWNYARKNQSWLKERVAGDRAGAISLIALAVAGGLLTALAAEATLDYKLVLGTVWTAVEAAGIFTLLKKIWSPKNTIS